MNDKPLGFDDWWQAYWLINFPNLSNDDLLVLRQLAEAAWENSDVGESLLDKAREAGYNNGHDDGEAEGVKDLKNKITLFLADY